MTSAPHIAVPSGAIRLNADCGCVTLDAAKLRRALADVIGDPDFGELLFASHPHIASAQPVFVATVQVTAMIGAIEAIETAARSEGYQTAVAARGGEMARFRPGPIGVFMGYDFHLAPDGPRLIEINTNAGGGLINAYLREAHRTCCQHLVATTGLPAGLDAISSAYLETFAAEWRRQGRLGSLRSIAIVDAEPESQYLYPEFKLFERLFQAHGIDAVIADPSRLHYGDSRLTIDGKPIDVVYNRLTDFTLSEPTNAALRAAYLSGDVVVTPNPWAHARFADKRNLAVLSSAEALESFGLPAETIDTILAVVPRTRVVDMANAETLWAERAGLFFKPWGGFGSKAAYRGDKLTRKVFAQIGNGGYVAQDLVAPSVRTVVVDGVATPLKTDLRAYTYDGRIMLVAARLYQGQTTNLRTAGGGFAPVLVVDDVMATCGCR